MRPSGIGGQAVIEGIMMKNKNRYSIAVRKPDNEIEVVVKQHTNLSKKIKILRIPIIRGVYNFVDSLIIGMSTLTYSAEFYEDPQEQAPTAFDKLARRLFKDKLDSFVMAVTILFAIVLALGLFMVLPFYTSRLLSEFIVSDSLLNLFEGLIRLGIFLAYVTLISLMNDIKRVYMYHGAEHKCINCIENGLELNVKNVRASSRLHKRCGTSFLLFVMLISIILFMFIKSDSALTQMGLRLVLVPVVAGISYEVLKLAGRTDNIIMKAISSPGLLLQKLTTKEPDDDMIEVAIAAIEAVFDWRAFRSVEDDDDDDAFEFIDDEDDVPEYVETFGAAAAANTFEGVMEEFFPSVEEDEVTDIETIVEADVENEAGFVPETFVQESFVESGYVAGEPVPEAFDVTQQMYQTGPIDGAVYGVNDEDFL